MITGRPLTGVTTRESLERVARAGRHPGLPAAAGRGAGPAAVTWASAWRPSSRPRPARACPGPSGPMGKESMRLRLAEDGIADACLPARCRTGRATRPPSRRSPLTSSACRSNRSGSSSGTATWSRSGSPAAAGRPRWPAAWRCTAPGSSRPRCSTWPRSSWKRAPRDLEITDGQVSVRGDPDSAIPVGEVARQAAAGQFGRRRRRQARSRGHVRRRGGRLVGRHPLRHRRGRRRDRHREGRAVRRGRGLRRAHQPRRRRGPDPRRRRPGHRRRAARTVRLRRGRQLPVGDVHGLPAADRLRHPQASRSRTWRPSRSTPPSTSAAWARAA